MQIKLLSIVTLALILPAAPALSGSSAAIQTTVPPVSASHQNVHYDAATGRLSLDVKEVSLSRLLADISRQTGVEILMDPAVERKITYSVHDQPLETGLNKLTRGLNAVMIHDLREVPGKGKQPMLITLKLLPEGQANTASLRPVLSPEAEAILHARGHDPATKPTFENERKARLEKMDPQLRERVEKHVQDKKNEKMQHKAKNAEQKVEKQQRRTQHIDERMAASQSMAVTNPELYQQRMTNMTNRKGLVLNPDSSTSASP